MRSAKRKLAKSEANIHYKKSRNHKSGFEMAEIRKKKEDNHLIF